MENKIKIKGLAVEGKLEVTINPDHIKEIWKLDAVGGWVNQSTIPGIDAKIETAVAGLDVKIKSIEGAAVELKNATFRYKAEVGALVREQAGFKLDVAELEVKQSEMVTSIAQLAVQIAPLIITN